jgi:hypothetical protein
MVVSIVSLTTAATAATDWAHKRGARSRHRDDGDAGQLAWCDY